MNPILYTIFEDNPQIPAEIFRFCRTLPDYLAAEERFEAQTDQVRQLLGWDRYEAFEQAMVEKMSYEARAHYLFGLGLRREVLEALARD